MCRVLVEFLYARVICEKQIIVFYLCFETRMLHIWRSRQDMLRVLYILMEQNCIKALNEIDS